MLAPVGYNLTLCGGPLSHTEGASLTVQGNGATIVQTCIDTGVIESTHDDSSLTLNGLGIIGGPNSGAFVFGPGVYGEGALHLEQVTITGVDGGPTGAFAAVTGSKNNMPGAPVTIVDSTITGNDTDGVNGSNVSLVLTQKFGHRQRRWRGQCHRRKPDDRDGQQPQRERRVRPAHHRPGRHPGHRHRIDPQWQRRHRPGLQRVRKP